MGAPVAKFSFWHVLFAMQHCFSAFHSHPLPRKCMLMVYYSKQNKNPGQINPLVSRQTDRSDGASERFAKMLLIMSIIFYIPPYTFARIVLHTFDCISNEFMQSLKALIEVGRHMSSLLPASSPAHTEYLLCACYFNLISFIHHATPVM